LSNYKTVSILDNEFHKSEINRITKFLDQELANNDDFENDKVRQDLIKLNQALKSANFDEKDHCLMSITWHTIKENAEASGYNFTNDQCEEIAADLANSYQSDWDFYTALDEVIDNYAEEHNIIQEDN